MIKSVRTVLLTACIVLLPYLYGCAASSSAERYSVKKQEAAEKQAVRFPADADTLKPSPVISETEYDDEDDYYSEEDSLIINQLLSRYSIPAGELDPNNISTKEKVVMEIIKYLNTPYKYGGTTSRGIDCSAFTKTIFNNIFSYELPRSAREQFGVGETIEKPALKFGDLVFFNTRRRVKPGHVGIYIGDNLFAHASRKYGVTVSSLEADYYARTFMGGRRIDDVKF